MDLTNLQGHYRELLSHMEQVGYSDTYIKRFRTEITRILKITDIASLNSYWEIYLKYESASHSKNYLRNKKTIIGAIEQFDLYGHFPGDRKRHTLYERGSYHLLSLEFKELIDFYKVYEQKRGKRETTISTESKNTASFLAYLQDKGCTSLESISEEAILSFFLSDSGELIKSCSYRKNISAVFKAGLYWKKQECQRVLSYLPMLRENRKNIQYLTNEEVQILKNIIIGNTLSFRNNAILCLLMYTGLRGCDIASMKLDSIDWQLEIISIQQQKTLEPLELPLSTIVGNTLFDYLNHERPIVQEPYLFLTETQPYTALKSRTIGSIVCKILNAAGIRQKKGERKGTHIFRHNLATTLLQNGISRPVISQTLGHTAPNSLDPYLSADFLHLKALSISVETFPIYKEVFSR